MDASSAESILAYVEATAPGITGPDARVALDGLLERHADVLAAMTWFIEADRPDDGLRIANAMYRFWITQQRFDEGALWFGRVLAANGGDEHLRAKAMVNAGFMPFWTGDDAQASELFGRALDAGRRLGDAPVTSQALGGLARVALRTDVPEARRLGHEALDVSTAAGDEAGRSNALHLLGVGAQIAGDLLEARDWMTQRLALVRATDNEFLIASEAANLGMVERQLGNLDEAEALDREALEIGERIGDQFTRPFAISGLACIALDRGRHVRAATLVGAAEAIMKAQNMAWPPDERPHYERLLTELPEAMGPAEFERVRSSGRSMAPSQVTAFALEGSASG